ncbi:uncharacterized protein B0H18DRAFT_1011165 [Fomitopsis serialis]|uniref:uncharacterized protein n=1 Tax=Fomitopsis serialis TaxID=139415 RepID=UPI0020089541|nr:uncharacterized protein B0H18DRAFT_1011165 [Neoantrodia serialis]KAH9924779.1 hypothetical protein B0H18DRAFT_1011165 [Neoantrodia serialis]
MSTAKRNIQKICNDSKDGSVLYEFGGEGYKSSVRHFLESSTDVAAYAVQPGSETTLVEIMKVIAKEKVPFAVKGGGHAMCPGFSSTTGAQISMMRFKQVKYDEKAKTLDVGAGCLWDEVYREVAKFKRNVVGGASADGVGVAGWLLGGGYSLKTNKYGLGIDNVLKYRIVLPNGRIRTATKDDKDTKDLYQALRGGGNNFGIVTQFTLKTHPQTATFGASLSFPGTREDRVKAAIVKFVKEESRPEAAIVSAFRHTLRNGKREYNISVLCVFDAPRPSRRADIPFRMFADLMKGSASFTSNPVGWNARGATTTLETLPDADVQNAGPEDGSDLEESGFREMTADEMHDIISPYDLEPRVPFQVVSDPDIDSAIEENASFAVSPSTLTARGASRGGLTAMKGVGELAARGRFHCIMVSKYTKKLIDAVAREAEAAAQSLKAKNGQMVLIDIWPFLPSIFDNSPRGAAWPHKKGAAFGPLLAYFRWEKAEDDKFWLRKMKTALKNIEKVALEEGCTTGKLPYYSNTSLEDVTARMIYRDNLKSLQKVRAKYDPDDVMGNTGGYKIPLPK